MSELTQSALLDTVVRVLNDTVRDWDMELEGGIGANTTLIEDLAFESIDIVQFSVALEQALGRKDLPFEKLFIQDGNYVDDVSVNDIIAFLSGALKIAA
jgi:acyl carrier protein